MKKAFLILMSLGMLNLFLFLGVFTLFQNKNIYNHSLGLISQNYERTGDWTHYQINKTSKPFLQIQNDNFLNWDAAIFKCISERMYIRESACYGKVGAAYFPLFPMIWKFTHASPIGISILNYFIFVISIALLVLVFLNTTFLNQSIVFSILITLPSSINFYIPYSESLFLFSMTLVSIGVFKNKSSMLFIGLFLLGMVRPATVFVFFAICIAELIVFSKHKMLKSFIKETALKSFPFILGYFSAICIQYAYSGSWTSLFEARKFWNPIVSFTHFSDWSIEGFGLSLFALCFVCIPSILFVLYLFLFRRKPFPIRFFENIKNYKSEYLIMISIFYFIGMLIFSLKTQGLDFHSFSRYILASPLFYMFVLILLKDVSRKTYPKFVFYYLIFSILLLILLANVEYGGDKIQFSFLGLYLFMLSGFLLFMNRWIAPSTKLILAIILIVLQSIWNTYLLNMFFCSGWIFT